jgi:hypothetical protein
MVAGGHAQYAHVKPPEDSTANDEVVEYRVGGSSSSTRRHIGN